MNFKGNETPQKLRGGYYTPLDLATFISKWAGSASPEKILEPSCGDGAFFDGLTQQPIPEAASVTAFELDAGEAARARSKANELSIDIDVRAADFLEWAIPRLHEGAQPFDAVVGNPPFIRYQYLPKNFQARSEQVFSELQCRFTKHTNAWVPFVLASMALLRPSGRLGMVIPSEIIHVLHAQPLRSYLAAHCRKLVIIDPEQLWFEGTLQGAVILLAEKLSNRNQLRQGISILRVRNREFLTDDPESLFRRSKATNGKAIVGKWTHALIDNQANELLDNLSRLENVRRFSDVAKVDVGIVTGANKFFLVDDQVIERYGLQNFAHPMFGRSEHCPGVIYDEAQHRSNSAAGKPTNFVWLPDTTATQKRGVRDYIMMGEEQQLHTRFKCRVRRPWYSVPSVYATDIGMLKRSHDAPRLILNRANAFTTDTAYRIKSKSVPADQLVANFLNPLTALSAELEGRHYGGGVLELVPSEIERLLLALPDRRLIDIERLDRMVREIPVASVISLNGSKVLGAIGVTGQQQDVLMQNWLLLRNRRNRVQSKKIGPESRQLSLAA